MVLLHIYNEASVVDVLWFFWILKKRFTNIALNVSDNGRFIIPSSVIFCPLAEYAYDIWRFRNWPYSNLYVYSQVNKAINFENRIFTLIFCA